MQVEIKKQTDLFSDLGGLAVAGWAKSPLMRYNREDSKIPKLWIKERDSYFISNEDCGLNLTVSDLGANTIINVTVADFKTGEINSRSITKYLNFGRISMPVSSEAGDVTYTDSRLGINFAKAGKKRFIKCDYINFVDGKNFYANFALEQKLDECLVTATPFHRNRTAFLLKQFSPLMRASGVIRFGGSEYQFSPEKSFAMLDWSRFSVPSKTCYQALYANGFVKGEPFALCLASGVGDNSKGSENCFFYKGSVNKLAQIKITSETNQIDKPWMFTAGISVLNLRFEPMIKNGRLLTIDSDRRTLVYGKLYGEIRQIDKLPIEIDGLHAYMELAVL